MKLRKQEANMGGWQIVGFAVLAAVVVGVIVNAKDIKRYIRMSTM